MLAIVKERLAVGTMQWWEKHRAVGRPAPLSGERITEAALKVIDTEGLAALTMRRVATELQTGAASLYRHIESREGLLMLVLDLVWDEVYRKARQIESGSPRERLIRTADCALDVYSRHQNLVPAMRVLPMGSPSSLALQEYIVGLIGEAGIEGKRALLTLHCLSQWVIGFILQEFQPGAATNEARRFPEILSSLDPDRFPLLASAGATAAQIHVDDEFQFGLNAVLDGLGF